MTGFLFYGRSPLAAGFTLWLEPWLVGLLGPPPLPWRCCACKLSQALGGSRIPSRQQSRWAM